MSGTSTDKHKAIEARVADDSYFEHLLASFMKLQEAYSEHKKGFVFVWGHLNDLFLKREIDINLNIFTVINSIKSSSLKQNNELLYNQSSNTLYK